MTTVTIKYSNEYMEEVINKELKRKQLKQLRKFIKYIGYVLVAIGAMGIAGAVGAYENNNIHTFLFVIQLFIFNLLLPIGAWFAGWFNEYK